MSVSIMRTRRRLAPLAMTFFLVQGCGVHDVVPYARVAFGAAQEPGTVLALHSSCTESMPNAGEVNPTIRPTCDFNRESAVDEIVRVTLEFAGHQVVDSERIDPAATAKEKVWIYADQEEGAENVTLAMQHLTPTLRRALSELGVEGVLSTAVIGGPVLPASGVQWIEVQLEMSRIDSGASVWRSHCRALVFEEGRRFIQSMEGALDAATACAIEAPRELRRRSAGGEQSP